MIFILLSVVQSTLIFIAFKLFRRFNIDNWQAITVNYMVAAGFGFLVYKEPYAFMEIPRMEWFTSAILLGIFFISTFFVFALSAQKVGVSLTSVASKMSVIIPVIFGIMLYDEELGFLKTTGILIALISFYLTFRKGRQQKYEPRYLVLPALMFLGNGFNDTLMKYTEHYFIDGDLMLYLSVVFLVSLLIGMTVQIVRILLKGMSIRKATIAGGAVLGLLNFGSTYYILRAMGEYESSVVFPVANSAIVALSALAGYFLFRERLSGLNWLGICLSIFAIILIAGT